MELENLKGIGIKSVKLLNNLGIYSMDDLVRNYPYRFDILKNMDINNSNNHDNITIEAVVQSSPVLQFFKGKMNRITFRVLAQNKFIKVVIFNRAFMKNNIKPGNIVTLIGKYNEKTETFTCINIF